LQIKLYLHEFIFCPKILSISFGSVAAYGFEKSSMKKKIRYNFCPMKFKSNKSRRQALLDIGVVINKLEEEGAFLM
jgi:hypothetical protein